jgi:hypothetical protein
LRTAVSLSLVAMAACAAAQSPDVVIRMDLLPTYRSENRHGSSFHFYDAMGRPSTAGLSLILEPGFRLTVTERLQPIEDDADEDQIDEYYLEDEGVWRLGKQYLPFARNGLLRESALAARADTNLVLEGLPIALAACDGGAGRPRGVIGRLGTRIGVSLAIGQNFGVSSGSFTAVRRPEEGPGRGRGYGQLLGLDAWRRIGSFIFSAEWIAMLNPSSELDEDRNVADIVVTYELAKDRWYKVAWSRDSLQTPSFFRAEGSIPIQHGAWLQPIVKVRGSHVTDVAVTVRVKF